MKIIRIALTLTLTTSLLVNSSGQGYALRPISSAVQVQADDRGSDEKDKAASGRRGGLTRRGFFSRTAAALAASVTLPGCRQLEAFAMRQHILAGGPHLYEYLPYFTDAKVSLLQPKNASPVPKDENDITIASQQHNNTLCKNALDKSLSYEKRRGAFVDSFFAYSAGDAAAKKRYFIPLTRS